MGSLLSNRRILVVEDEMMVLMVIEDMLAELGCESVTVAATLEQALAQIDAGSFHAAMLDVNLNGSKSYPLADVLAARGIPFIFATGYNGHGTMTGYGDRPLLIKPFRLADLVEVLTPLFSEQLSDSPTSARKLDQNAPEGLAKFDRSRRAARFEVSKLRQ